LERGNAKKKNKDGTAATAAPVKYFNPPQSAGAQGAFEYMYREDMWGGRDDPKRGNGSGVGSSIDATIVTRQIIYNVTKILKVKKILDAPCGAMVWMPPLLENLTREDPEFEYQGVDVVRDVIYSNRQKFVDQPRWKFNVCDLSLCSLPYGYDLIFTRDALQHMPYLSVFKFIRHVKETDATFFLAGHYPTLHLNRNLTILGDGFNINLFDPPFNFPEPIQSFSEGNYTEFEAIWPEKFLSLWYVEDLRKWEAPEEWRSA